MCSFTFFDGLLCLVAVVVLLAGLVKLYLCHAGTEIIVPQVESRSRLAVDEQTEDSLTISTVIEFVNEGKQCATIMDALVRPQLPYEQYDGLETRGHAELVTAPRARCSHQLRMAAGFQAVILLIRQLRTHQCIHDGSALLTLIYKLNHRTDGQTILSLLIHSQPAAALHLRHNNLRACMAQVQLHQPCQQYHNRHQTQQPIKKSK